MSSNVKTITLRSTSSVSGRLKGFTDQIIQWAGPGESRYNNHPRFNRYWEIPRKVVNTTRSLLDCQERNTLVNLFSWRFRTSYTRRFQQVIAGPASIFRYGV